LEFKRINGFVYISEIYFNDGDNGQLICYEEQHFKHSSKAEGFSICITIAELLIEVNTKTNMFIEDLKRLNPLLIESSSIFNSNEFDEVTKQRYEWLYQLNSDAQNFRKNSLYYRSRP